MGNQTSLNREDRQREDWWLLIEKHQFFYILIIVFNRQFQAGLHIASPSPECDDVTQKRHRLLLVAQISLQS